MSERVVRFEELALGYTPDLPDQKPLLWEDGRGLLFRDKSLQPMPGQIPLVSVGVPVNAVSSTNDLVFLGTESSVLVYSLTAAELKDVTPTDDPGAKGDWSFQPFGNWMLAVHNGKFWIWKPRVDDADDPAHWPHDTFQPVADFPEDKKPFQLIKCKNFVIAVCKDSILWCDDDNPEVWTPELDNLAGDLFIRDIQGEIRGGVGLEDFCLLATQKEIVLVNYYGRPYVFGYKKLYEGAGIWNAKSICLASRSIFGFGPNGIWASDGNGLNFIDKERVGSTIDEGLDINRISSCFCANWNILQHVFFFTPLKGESNEEILCFGFNLENSTWTILEWDRFCSYKEYWVDSSGTLYLDDLKNAQNLGKQDGHLPLPEEAEGLVGMCYEGYGLLGYGGKIWCQV